MHMLQNEEQQLKHVAVDLNRTERKKCVGRKENETTIMTMTTTTKTMMMMMMDILMKISKTTTTWMPISLSWALLSERANPSETHTKRGAEYGV
jgi:hypothetical protein